MVKNVEPEDFCPISCQLTVLFEDPFWIGLFERKDDRGYAVARVVFGAEPTDVEVYTFIQQNYTTLRYSDPLPDAAPIRAETNFKRRQREARRCLAEPKTSTKAQEALSLEREKNKRAQQETTKAERDALADHKFHLRQEKRKQKKLGH